MLPRVGKSLILGSGGTQTPEQRTGIAYNWLHIVYIHSFVAGEGVSNLEEVFRDFILTVKVV